MKLEDRISRKHCRSQFNLLKAEFETLFPVVPQPGASQPLGQAAAPALDPAAKLAREIIDGHADTQQPDSLEWTAVYRLHRCVLSLLSDEALQRAAWAIRERYREMFGEREYANYVESNPPDLNGPEYQAKPVLADTERLLELIYSNYMMGPDNSQVLRRRIIATMITIGSGLGILGLLLAFVFHKEQFAGATLLIVGLVGATGGLVSVLQRLLRLGGSGDALTDFHEIQGVRYSAVFAAGVIGALFAGVLYLMFAGGLIEGRIFPTLGQATTAQADMRGPAGQPPAPAPEAEASGATQTGSQPVQPSGVKPASDTAQPIGTESILSASTVGGQTSAGRGGAATKKRFRQRNRRSSPPRRLRSSLFWLAPSHAVPQTSHF